MVVYAIIHIHSFNTQPPEGGWQSEPWLPATPHRFNTQPPEGGWKLTKSLPSEWSGFNTQPPEGGWLPPVSTGLLVKYVSTHSRLKAAGLIRTTIDKKQLWFQHTAA